MRRRLTWSSLSLTRSTRLAIVSLASLLPTTMALGSDEPQDPSWSRFRGPNGSGLAQSLQLPNDFSLDSHLLWKSDLGNGNSTVVAWGDAIFTTSFDGDQRIVSRYNLADGLKVWEQKQTAKRRETATPPNSPATCSPTCNDDLVVAFFPDTGLVAYHHDGSLAWEVDLGPFYSMHGISASPILVEDKVIVVIDQLQASYTVALDAKTGKEAWRADRLIGVTGGYSTPLVYTVDNEAYILSAAPGELAGYRVSNGEKALSTIGIANAPVGQPVLVGNQLFYSEPPGEPIPMQALGPADKNNDGVIELEEVKNSVGTYRLIERIDQGFGNNDGKVDQAEWDKGFGTFLNKGGLSCVTIKKVDGKLQGEVTWRYTKATPYISSVLVVDQVVYIVNDGGILISLDASSGKVLKQSRLSDATGSYYASPIAAQDRLVLASRDGKVSLVQHGQQWNVLTTVDFSESIVATPTIHQGRLLVRSGNTLYCLGS